MHIPDGFLDVKTMAATGALSAAGVSLALRQLRRGLPRRRVPLMGLAAAFLFAAQMLNFPVAAGTSGHLVGAALAAALLGPAAAIVVVTAVLVVQALLFADGGLLALGANVLNMALIGVLGGYAAFRLLERLLPGERGFLTAIAFASWWSILLASMACAGEIASSGVAPWRLVFPAMAGIHMLIGLGEALIAALVAAAILRTRPELLNGRAAAPTTGSAIARGSLAFGLLAITALVVFGVPLASTQPDGLERVADSLGFSSRAGDHLLPAPMPDYQVPLLGTGAAATWAAAIAGVMIVFVLSYALAIALARRQGQAAVRGPLSALRHDFLDKWSRIDSPVHRLSGVVEARRDAGAGAVAGAGAASLRLVPGGGRAGARRHRRAEPHPAALPARPPAAARAAGAGSGSALVPAARGLAHGAAGRRRVARSASPRPSCSRTPRDSRTSCRCCAGRGCPRCC